MNRDDQFVNPKLFTNGTHTDGSGNQRFFYYNHTSEFMKKQNRLNVEQKLFNQKLTILLESMKKEYFSFSHKVKDEFCKQDSVNLKLQKTIKQHENVYNSQMDQLKELKSFYQTLFTLTSAHTDQLSQQTSLISSQKRKIQSVQDQLSTTLDNKMEKQHERTLDIENQLKKQQSMLKENSSTQTQQLNQLVEHIKNYENTVLYHTHILDEQAKINRKLTDHIKHYKSTHSHFSKKIDELENNIENILGDLKGHGDVFTKHLDIFNEQNDINEKLTNHIKQVNHLQSQLSEEMERQKQLIKDYQQQRDED